MAGNGFAFRRATKASFSTGHRLYADGKRDCKQYKNT